MREAAGPAAAAEVDKTDDAEPAGEDAGDAAADSEPADVAGGAEPTRAACCAQYLKLVSKFLKLGFGTQRFLMKNETIFEHFQISQIFLEISRLKK